MYSSGSILSPRAHSHLAFLLEAHATRTPSLLLLTGPSGGGKTTWCRALQQFAGEHDVSVAGLLSPAVMDGGQKIAIDLEDLGSGERRRLATRTQLILDGAEEMPPGGVMTGDWSFDPETIRWGNSALASLACPDLLIIDELGPLEFRQKQGLQAGLKLIDSWRCSLICATIRPALMGAARMRWPWSQILVVGEEEAQKAEGSRKDSSKSTGENGHD